jgi:hypothetical protein
MKIKYYFEFSLRERFQLRKWLIKNSPYPVRDVVNHIYGFYIKEINNTKFELHGLTYQLK